MDQDIAICWGAAPAGVEAAGILERAARFSAGTGLSVQLFDASMIAGAEHLMSAAMHALRALGMKSMRSSSVGMEMMLYASGRRQIKDAIGLVGLKKSTRKIAAVIVGEDATGKCGELLAALGLERLTEEKAAGGAAAIARLNIPSKGVPKDRLKELALEHVALLDIER